MKKKFLVKAGAFALSVGILLPTTTNAAYGETTTSNVPATTENVKYEQTNEMNNEKAFIEVRDKKGNVIKTYSKEEVEKLNQNLAPLSYETFGPAQFSSYKWIASKKNFYRPKSVNVEADGKVCGLTIGVYDSREPVGEVSAKGCFTGGLNLPISHLTDRFSTNYYSLKLINKGGGTIYLLGGQVYY
ncbi:hypothetical protein [Bacillus gaemokensis]|uniref:Uncharacterized protein n=1 Tax=Bacillus gaemokensis TaxID=574375 RepID=A0A073K697_9BACI|nr:hypothetical protein [Bacillus gaemokensis]KEK22066.1 hypothetical protein BAGA_22500 [Bacillus gaemokensis]KYG37769.1 hypothetical protein AZF08_21795 [Bacillus gaemokensis]